MEYDELLFVKTFANDKVWKSFLNSLISNIIPL